MSPPSFVGRQSDGGGGDGGEDRSGMEVVFEFGLEVLPRLSILSYPSELVSFLSSKIVFVTFLQTHKFTNLEFHSQLTSSCSMLQIQFVVIEE